MVRRMHLCIQGSHIPDGGRFFVCVCGVSIVIGGLCVGGGQVFPRYMVDQ